MAVTDQLRRTSVTWLVAYPEAFADWQNPTAAELNGPLVYEITCAVDEDGTTFSLGDSDTDDSYTYCDESGMDRPTFYNPEVTLNILRDADRTATGEFNTAFNLFRHPDIELNIIKRVGDQDNTPGAPVAVGDRISMQNIKTDVMAESLGSEEAVAFEATGLQQGRVLWQHEVTA